MNTIPAVGTGCSIPVRQPAVRGSGVVSSEDLRHEQKELTEPSLFQCLGDGVSAIPFAEDIVLHVGMRDIVVSSRFAGIERDHRVRLVAAELVE